MRVFYEGDPWAGGTPAEEYRYEASGYRYLREGRDGRPLLSLRNADGKTLSVYAIEPDQARPVLERDLLYGLGQLLVERIAGEPAPDPSAASTMSAGGDFLVDLADPGAFATYSVDIRADSGYSSHLDARIVDAEGRLHVPETALSAGETNYLRVAGEGLTTDSILDTSTDQDWTVAQRVDGALTWSGLRPE